MEVSIQAVSPLSIFGAAYMELLTGNANPGVMLFPSSIDDPALPLLGYEYAVPPERRTRDGSERQKRLKTSFSSPGRRPTP